MKTVTIEGKDYEVPDKATCYAKDSDGAWHWYDHKAYFERVYKAPFGYWYAYGRSGFICYSTSWETTLTMIE